MWKLYIISMVLIYTSAQKCTINSECPQSFNCSDGVCTHKSVEYFNRTEIIGSILITLITSLSNAGGIGSGLIVLPVLIIMFGLNVHAAIPLCDVVILGGSLIGIWMKIMKRDPLRDRPLIMYDLILLIMSPLLFGTTIGVMVNTFTPDSVIFCLVSLVLAYFSYKSFILGNRIYLKETQARQEQWDSISMSYESSDEYFITLSQVNSHNSELSIKSIQQIEDPEITKELTVHKLKIKRQPSLNSKQNQLYKLSEIYIQESRILPYKEFGVILSMYLLFVVLSVVNNDKLSVIGIERCSEYYVYILLSFWTICLVITGFIMKWISYKTQLKDLLGYDWEERDFKMEYKNMSVICSVSFIAGVSAGMLGMSGGTFISPLLLTYKIRPELTAATSSFLLFLTSSISIVQYLYNESININLGVTLLLCSSIGSLVGISIVNRIVERYNRASVLVICISITLTVSSIAVLIYTIHSFSSQYFKISGFNGWQYFC